jgi:hypothetical protein
LAASKVGRRDRDDGLAEQADDLQARIAARAVADGQVDLAGREIDDLHAGRQPDVDLGLGLLELAQARHQPLGGERRGGGQGQAAAVDGGGQQGCGLGQAVEGLAQGGQGGLGGVGQQQALGRALEQGRADIVLQVLDLLADGAGRHRQLVGGAAEVQVARGGLERAQGVQGGSLRRRSDCLSMSFTERPGRRPCLRIGPPATNLQAFADGDGPFHSAERERGGP